MSWTEYPAGQLAAPPAPSLFAQARDALLKSQGEGFAVLPAESLPAGERGLVTAFRTAQGRIVEVRFFWAPGRFFQVMAETPDRPEARAVARQFLDSFGLGWHRGI